MRLLSLTTITIAMIGSAAKTDYLLEFSGTSFREYYCGVTLVMTNQSDAPLVEINAFVASYIGDEQIGRSRGASFLNLGPGESASALFEAPHAPCDEATRYEFVVGACRIDTSFSAHEDCSSRITGIDPVAETARP